MSCDKCSALLERLNRARDKKEEYAISNKRLRAKIAHQKKQLDELARLMLGQREEIKRLEKKHGNDV